MLGKGVNLQDVDAVRKPLPSRFLKVVPAGRLYPFQGHFIVIRGSTIHFIPYKNIGLAAKAAYPFDASDEPGPVLRFYPFHLVLRWTPLEKRRKFFIKSLFYFRKINALLRSGYDDELSANFAQIHVSRNIRCYLIFIHQSLVQTRIFPYRQHVAHQIEIIGLG